MFALKKYVKSIWNIYVKVDIGSGWFQCCTDLNSESFENWP